jgi:RNA polymerase sigma-70 factor (ECF subfamily)
LSDIKAIINGCLEGNRRDQELLYRRYASKLYAVCLRYSSDSDEAKDILQEGFIKIFENLYAYKFEGAFEGWMRRIVVNTALEKYKNRNVLYKVEDIDMLTETEMEPDVEDYSGLDVKVLMNIIKELPPKYRTVFNLFAIEGYSHKEISKMVKITVGGSKSNLSRARLILQRKLETYAGIKRKVVNG